MGICQIGWVMLFDGALLARATDGPEERRRVWQPVSTSFSPTVWRAQRHLQHILIFWPLCFSTLWRSASQKKNHLFLLSWPRYHLGSCLYLYAFRYLLAPRISSPPPAHHHPPHPPPSPYNTDPSGILFAFYFVSEPIILRNEDQNNRIVYRNRLKTDHLPKL